MTALFGTHLRESRKKQRITAEMLAQDCGVSRSYITLMENNKRLPGKKIIPKIAVALNLKTSTILNWYLEHIRYQLQKDLKIHPDA